MVCLGAARSGSVMSGSVCFGLVWFGGGLSWFGEVWINIYVTSTNY